MNTKNIFKGTALWMLLVLSCTKMDHEYAPYLKNGELIYVGSPSNLETHPGKGRVEIQFTQSKDPNIVKYIIYWNDRSEKQEVPANKKDVVQKVIINGLPEGNYPFEIIALDSAGNTSTPGSAIINGEVLGDQYQSNCINRAIINTEIQPDGTASITWADIDATLGIINMEIKYSDNDNKAHDTLITSVPAGLITLLPNFKAGNSINYRTLYLPGFIAIDTFYVDYQRQGIKQNVTGVYLKNYQQPFTSMPESGTGRWRNPTDWTVTGPVMNHGGYGGWGSDDGTVLAMEAGWGADPINNGKMFQTLFLPAGNYTFSVVLGNHGFSDPVYMVAAAGSTLPDASLVPANSIGYASLNDQHFDFTITKPTTVSIGFVANMTTGNEYWRVSSVQLIKN